MSVRRDVQVDEIGLMPGGLKGTHEDCTGERNIGEKFLEVVNTRMNPEVPELFSRQKEKAIIYSTEPRTCTQSVLSKCQL